MADSKYNSGSGRDYRKPLVCDPIERRTKSDPTVNIHHIVRKYGVTGGHPVARVPLADGGQRPDLMSALNLIADAQNRFSELPANVRFKEFGNDFRNFYFKTQNPADLESLVKKGILSYSDEAIARKKDEAAAAAAASKPVLPAPDVKT